MDLAEIKRRALEAREFSKDVGPEDSPRRISLRIPTQHEITIASRRAGLHQTLDDGAAHLVLERSLLVLAVVGWSGVKVSDVLPGGPGDAFPWEAGATELLLDAQPDWARVLYQELLARLVERRTVRDTAEKNSLA